MDIRVQWYMPNQLITTRLFRLIITLLLQIFMSEQDIKIIAVVVAGITVVASTTKNHGVSGILGMVVKKNLATHHPDILATVETDVVVARFIGQSSQPMPALLFYILQF